MSIYNPVVMLAHHVSTGDGSMRPVLPQYLKFYDIEAYDGRGTAEFTRDRDQALCFLSAKDAMEAWRAVPANRPLRPDGCPNRPLTAFTMEIKEL